MEKISIKKLVDKNFMEGVSDISLYSDIDLLHYNGIITLYKASYDIERVLDSYNFLIFVNNNLIAIIPNIKVVKLWVDEKAPIYYELQD